MIIVFQEDQPSNFAPYGPSGIKIIDFRFGCNTLFLGDLAITLKTMDNAI